MSLWWIRNRERVRVQHVDQWNPKQTKILGRVQNNRPSINHDSIPKTNHSKPKSCSPSQQFDDLLGNRLPKWSRLKTLILTVLTPTKYRTGYKHAAQILKVSQRHSANQAYLNAIRGDQEREWNAEERAGSTYTIMALSRSVVQFIP